MSPCAWWIENQVVESKSKWDFDTWRNIMEKADFHYEERMRERILQKREVHLVRLLLAGDYGEKKQREKKKERERSN